MMYGETYTYTPTTPDASVQSPRIFEAFSNGGGVLHNYDSVAGIRRRGFLVSSIVPTQSEYDYLVSINPNFEGKRTIWLVNCPYTKWAFPNGDFVCSAVQPEGAIVYPQDRERVDLAGFGGSSWVWWGVAALGVGTIWRQSRLSQGGF
jgi:hypothetical protein